MAKGNPFLGMARGSAGDFTYYRMMGEQVFRARNRHPSNPRTTLQLIQRCVMLTAQRAYSMLSPLCDHSFQGRTPGTMSQARFTVLNNGWMRDALAPVLEDVAHGDESTYGAEANYAGKFSLLPEFMPYIISEGSIPPLNVQFSSGYMFIHQDNASMVISAATTYNDVLELLGLNPGDQLTFVLMTVDDTVDSGTFNGIKYARVVLAPSDGDFTKPMFEAVDSVFKIKADTANAANDGEVYFRAETVDDRSEFRFTFTVDDEAEENETLNTAAACAVIVSRRVGDVWQRSTSRLVLRPYTVGTGNLHADHGVDYLGDAVDSFRTASDSTRYLNQAEQL